MHIKMQPVLRLGIGIEEICTGSKREKGDK
jgi:hypothetical protein